jgi:hypothetical protein
MRVKAGCSVKTALKITHYCDINLKNPLEFVAESVSCSCRFVKFKVCRLVRAVQLLRSGLSSSAIFVEGTSQEKLIEPVDDEIFICGAGDTCKVQIPLVEGMLEEPAAANNFFPSAEQATAFQAACGALFDIPVRPKFVVV